MRCPNPRALGIDIVRVTPHVDRSLAESILAVQKAAYAVEAELIGDDRIPLLHETVGDLSAADVLWAAAEVEGSLAGAIAWTSGGEIDRLVVSPDFHRRRVGRALVAFALREIPDPRVRVATGRDNAPARRLYESLGFVHTEDQQVRPGLWLARYYRPEAAVR